MIEGGQTKVQETKDVYILQIVISRASNSYLITGFVDRQLCQWKRRAITAPEDRFMSLLIRRNHEETTRGLV